MNRAGSSSQLNMLASDLSDGDPPVRREIIYHKLESNDAEPRSMPEMSTGHVSSTETAKHVHCTQFHDIPATPQPRHKICKTWRQAARADI